MNNKLVFHYRRLGREIKDFGKSWRDGIAFNALVHSIRAELVDMEQLQYQTNRQNLEQAFDKAETHLGVPRLLDAEGKGHRLKEERIRFFVTLNSTGHIAIR